MINAPMKCLTLNRLQKSDGQTWNKHKNNNNKICNDEHDNDGKENDKIWPNGELPLQQQQQQQQQPQYKIMSFLRNSSL